ncbi:hypothetical protein BC833DRAFT_571499 [Globomyces pollinis-pini]|nr:hypothetical protein BC833DRAFT_571499 [Globomyces pollinis-pini]
MNRSDKIHKHDHHHHHHSPHSPHHGSHEFDNLEINNSQVYRSTFNPKLPSTNIYSKAYKAKNITLPSLGPLTLHVAPPVIPPVDKNQVYESSHEFIQNTWTTFSNLGDSHRNQLLKGLLTRCSSKQIEFICTCLNIKSLDENAHGNPQPTKIFPPDMLGKYLISNRAKATNFSIRDQSSSNSNKIKSEETFKEAMHRAFSTDNRSLNEFLVSSPNGSFLNGNTYIKLLNNEINPDALTKQVAKSGPEGLRFLMLFLGNQCQKLQNVMKSLLDVSNEVEIEKAAFKLFTIILEVTDAKFGTIYFYGGANSSIQIFCSNWKEVRKLVKEEDIIASSVLLKGEIVNIYNFRSSDYHKSNIETVYQAADPDCILSAPFYGDGMKVVGYIELISKNTGNPFFNAEDEFMIKSLSGICTILFNQINVKVTATKKSDDIKQFMQVTNSMGTNEVEMGGLLSVILQTARDLVNAERCAVFLLDKEKGELWSKVAQDSAEIRFPVTKGIAGYVVSTGEIANIANAWDDERFNKDFDLKTGFRTKSILCVPMRDVDGEIVGAVQAINKKNLIMFTDEDSAQLESFSTLAISTIEKSDEINMLNYSLNEQIYSNQYLNSILQSMNSVIMTLSENGKLMTMENGQLLKFEEITNMRLTSHEHWLGRLNSELSDDISKVILTNEIIHVTNYDFHLSKTSLVSINYFIRRIKDNATPTLKAESFLQLPTTAPKRRVSTAQSARNRSISAERSSSAQLPVSILVVLEISLPNRMLLEQLGKQIPNSTMSALINDPTKMEGETLNVISVVVDIRRFASMMKHLVPSKVSLLLNRFYDMILQASKRHNGIITQMNADSAVLIFGAPFSASDDIIRGLNASLDIKKGIEIMNKTSDEFSLPPMFVSIGVAMGPALCSPIGPTNLQCYQCIGEPIKDAFEMEYFAKFYGSGIVATDAIRNLVKDSYHIREVDKITTKETLKTITIYEIMEATISDHNHDLLSTVICYELGLAEYRARNWPAALMHFKKSLTLTDDLPSKCMMERCKGLIDGRFDVAEDWDLSWSV